MACLDITDLREKIRKNMCQFMKGNLRNSLTVNLIKNRFLQQVQKIESRK